MNKATRVAVSTFGALAGLMGIEHGLGAVLQGNTAPAAMVYSSWPGSELFEILNGEPAMSLIPNFLVTGILAILLSLIFLWVVLRVPGRHTGLYLALLSTAMLVAGAGFGPPLIGFIVAATASRLHASFPWLRAHLPAALGRGLSVAWPWLYAGSLVAWLGVFPGTILLDHFVGIADPELVVFGLIGSAFGLMFLTIGAGLVRDAQQRGKAEAPAANWLPVPSPRR